MKIRYPLALAITLCSQLAFSQIPVLLKDINTTTVGVNSSPAKGAWMGGNYYFAATNAISGVELWKTDGTTGNTVLLKDINYGNASSSPTSLVAVGSTLYFTANDGMNGAELWKTDGTTNGTMMIKDIRSGGFGSSPSNIFQQGTGIIFSANDGVSGDELWKSDGTAAGTVLIKEINAGYIGGSLNRMIGTGTKLYFSANTSTVGGNYELYKSDGTAAGTGLVKELDPSAVSGGMVGAVFVWGETLYFGGSDGTNGAELWKSDGTSAGTTMVKDIFTGSSGGFANAGNPSNFCVMNGKLYFSASDANGVELWVTDGTNAGTTMVKDIYAGTSSSSPSQLTAVGNTLFFRANDGTNGVELWKSDGTNAGTSMVANLNAGSAASTPAQMIAIGSTLYFSATDGTNGIELWKSNGTAGGTTIVKDINTIAAASSTPANPVSNGTIFMFSADNGTNGIELWKSDGTNANTVLVKNINPDNGNSVITGLTAVGSRVVFSATDGINGLEPWSTDGTVGGTFMLQDINTSTAGASSTPVRFTTIGSKAVFGATNGTTTGFTGNELYVTDGTVAGTSLLKDINPGTSGSSPRNFVPHNGFLYFQANEPVNGNELWRTDGTAGNTVLVKDIVAGTGSSSPGMSGTYPAMISGGSNLFFAAINQTTGQETGWELYSSTGAIGSGALLKDINTSSFAANSAPTNFVYQGSGNTVYFTAYDGTAGSELFKSDGTAGGTSLIKDITPGAQDTDFDKLIILNGKVYFTAYSATQGSELWVSDGTNAGTVVFKDINPGIGSSAPQNLTVCGSYIYFSADNGTNGRELWRTDGTTANTIMIQDIVPGSESSNPSNFMYDAAHSAVFFSAYTPANGVEIWRSVGTSANLYAEVVAGAESTNPGPIMLAGNNLIFVGTNGSNGLELYGVETFTLPLKLMNFSGHAAGETVVLDWKTANEISTARFEIERSADGTRFSSLASVNAFGSGDHAYTTVDEHPLTGNNFYRLKMFDVDGRFSYSNVVLVEFANNSILRISPVPAISFVNVTVKDASLIGQRARIFNAAGAMMGEVVLQRTTRIEIANWARGIYTLKTSKAVYQFMKQ